MTTIELHNQLLEFRMANGDKDLRADFNFENLFESSDCSYCGNGTVQVLAIIHPEVPAKYCPMCGRAIRKESNNNVSTM